MLPEFCVKIVYIILFFNENKRFHDARNNETDATMKQM
jgi:hypothetical protein